MNSRPLMPLGDVLTLQRGFDITRTEQLPGIVPVVSSSGIGSYHNRAMVCGPGVVIGRKGSLGTAYFIGADFWPHDTTLWVKDFKGNHPRWCYYLLSSMKLGSYDVGASNPTLNRNHVHLLPVVKPSLSEQHRIASILSAYDDLIEVNRRRVAILEEMARRLFEEWFVHLRFPGHEAITVHHTPDGPLPGGWSCRPLGQLLTEERDTVLPVDLDGATMYVGLEHIPRRSTTLTEWGSAEEVVSAKLRFQPGDILFGKIRPYFHKVAIAPAHGVSSTDAIVLRSRLPKHAGIAAAVAASDAFVAHAVQTSNGTKMPRANWTVLARYPVRLPPEPLLNQFNSCVIDGINQAISLAAANTRLAAARDLLLPRLVSGELSVAHAPTPDRLLEAAD